MNRKLVVGNLNSGLIEFGFDLFQNTPSGSPVFLCLHPCPEADHDRAVSQIGYKYYNFFILNHRQISVEDLLYNMLCLLHIRIIGDAHLQIQFSLRPCRNISQTVLGAPLPQFLVRAIAVLRADVSQRGGGDGDA